MTAESFFALRQDNKFVCNYYAPLSSNAPHIMVWSDNINYAALYSKEEVEKVFDMHTIGKFSNTSNKLEIITITVTRHVNFSCT